jgi:hypothetical protein
MIRLRALDRGFVALTGLAVLIIAAMLGVILGNIAWNGWAQVTWEFLTAAPRQGMTEGGVFPAIYGTVLLVLLMTIFVVPPPGGEQPGRRSVHRLWTLRARLLRAVRGRRHRQDLLRR